MGDLREPNCVAAEESLLTSSSSSLIGPERWAKAEKAAQKIISKVQPTTVSEERRRQVIDYVQRLIRGSLGCEVFPYGSVPLKTYLPDGDIDLTAFGGTSVEDVLANDMVSVLEGEDRNGAAEFVVKDVQLIRAEVKLVKCIVQNIVVDISFNQIGGLCTLCFLEQVDRLIGKDHLFKRSILLIKAWCYYESRILGAHHGLISTYALETLVLYIFHLFHSTLDGPLAVLYKFLDYFSKFEWENYCISLTGRVHISSLPEIVAKTPAKGGDDLLLSSDFLRYCIDMFSVPSRGGDMGSRTFPQKYLNIVDPLKENNNLGRSVSKGNFYRIRSAFNYGARKLGRILVQPEDSIADELHKFFSSTLERHGHGQRPDVQDPAPLYNYNCSDPTFAIPESESSQAGKVISETKTNNLAGTLEGYTNDPDISSQYGVDDTRATEMGAKVCVVNEELEPCGDVYHSVISSDTNGPVAGNVWNHHHLEYREDVTSSRIRGCIISNDDSKISASSIEECVSAAETTCHAPHLCSNNSLLCDGEINLDSKQLRICKESMFSKVSQGFDEGIGNIGCLPDDNVLVGKDEVLAGRSWDVSLTLNSIPSSKDKSSVNQGTSSSGSPERNNPLSDLSGDYDSHFNCLQYGRWCYEYGAGAPIFAIPPTPPHFQMQISWDPIQHASLFKQNGYSHGNANGGFPSPAFYTMNPLVMPGVAYGLEDMPKPRGTGTYFPNTSRLPQGYRPSAKGRSQPASRSPRNNGRTSTFRETSNHDRSSHELPQAEVPLDQSGTKHGSLDAQQLFSPRGKGHPKVNGAVIQSEGLVKFGSVGQVPVGAPLLDHRSRQQKPVSSSSQNSSPVSPTLGMQRLRPVFGRDYDRVSLKSSYRLRDEDDFPPLSV